MNNNEIFVVMAIDLIFPSNHISPVVAYRSEIAARKAMNELEQINSDENFYYIEHVELEQE